MKYKFKEGSSMKTRIFAVKALTIFSFCLIAVSMLYIQQATADNTNQNSTEKQSQSVISPIDSKYVCMINNQSFNKEQIPVEIEGKTYYGCCQSCEAKLKSDPSSRNAVDPVSGRQVDKATAVIGATPEGNIYYFESQENLEAFTKNSKD
jgi:YHS domain-containing protein